ncbi:MAG: alpha/beta hydrolase [Chloroflexi bacterium]|nr:alpha/beta hydrolase [Chloroflexota bacterium]
MPTAKVNGANIYYEVTGEGFPLLWSHEFAGDYRAWEPQVRFFSRRYKVITYNARGYPPSDVPTDPQAYSQDIAVDDLRGLLEHLGIRQAHVGGLSMGGNVALNFGLKHPQLARSLIVAGTGSGSVDPEVFRQRVEERARSMEAEGMKGAMDDYGRGPTRVQLLRKDPRGWQEFADHFFEHSSIGSAMMFRRVMKTRPPIFELEDRLKALDVPTLILVGDEDEPCIEPAIFMKRCIPRSGLVFFPQSGHAINLEEPELFNRTVLDFLTAVESGKWAKREAGVQSGALVER